MIKNYFVREQVFFILTLILCLCVIFHFIFPFMLGITFAYLLEPIVDKTSEFLRIKKNIWRWVISVALILITLILIFGPILTLITTAIQELIAVLSGIQNMASGHDLILLFAQKTSKVLENFGVHFSIDELVIKSTDFLKTTSHTLLTQLGNALYATPEFIVKFFVFILTWCFFLVKGNGWRARFLIKILPWQKERDLISRTCASVIKALIVANVMVAVVQALLITLIFALFGLPRFILLGMVGFFISFIPVIGTAPLMIGAAAWCYFSQGRILAAMGILACSILVGILDNVLRPYFMKGGTEIQFFWIFLAIIGGMSLFGIPGAVIGPVSFALFAAALTTLESSRP